MPPNAAPEQSPTAHGASHARARYWAFNLRLTAALLFAWVFITFGVSFFARDLTFRFFGWPFSFWMASQGALMLYALIVWIYARAMDRMDASLNQHPGSER